MANKPLAGKKILLTRPAAQAENLATLIAEAGGEAIRFPVLEIEPIPPTQWIEIDWSTIDKLFFVSRNAVHTFKASQPVDLPPETPMFALGGDGTAQAMKICGYQVDAVALGHGGTEAMLAQIDTRAWLGQKAVIVRGDGGRTLFAETLRAQGVSVAYIEVYRRLLPSMTQQQCQMACQADIVMATSVQSVQHLMTLLRDGFAALLEKPLVVVSERIRQYALTQGFKRVLVTTKSGDNAMLETLISIGREDGKHAASN